MNSSAQIFTVVTPTHCHRSSEADLFQRSVFGANNCDPFLSDGHGSWAPAFRRGALSESPPTKLFLGFKVVLETVTEIPPEWAEQARLPTILLH